MKRLSLIELRWLTLGILVIGALLSPIAQSYTASASHLKPSGKLWAYDAAGNNAQMNVWDLSIDSTIATFVPRDGNGRGVAYDPTDGNIWTSTLLPGSFNGDGLIHKNPPLGGPDITTIPEPGGMNGPGIGALDYDNEDNTLWAAVYQAINGQSLFYKLNPSNGNVLKTCSIPFQGDVIGNGNDTLAIARPADLNGTKVLLTDAGVLNTILFAIDTNSCAIIKTYTLPVSVTGIDVDDVTGNVIGTNLGSLFNLGPAPYATIVASFPTSSNHIEDISLEIGELADTDEDGIPDDIEENGYDFQGEYVDLPGMGAKKDHKDIFVYIDWIEGATSDHKHKPSDEAINQVIMAFQKAPVDNKDLLPGINLHIVFGQKIEETDENNELGFAVGACDYNWNEFDSYKLSNFPQKLWPMFHYVIFGHHLPEFPCQNNQRIAGISRNKDEDLKGGASDFIVALGTYEEYPDLSSIGINLTTARAGVFMHELGHNLGLGHGGVILSADGTEVVDIEGTNLKPNHLSVMNYSFQSVGLRQKSLQGGFIYGTLDYSQFGPDVLPDLNEAGLSEPDGLRAGAAVTDYGTVYYCQGTNDKKRIDGLQQAVDWNCDTDEIDANFARDINKDGTTTSLTTVNEWAHLRYDGGFIGAFGVIVELPEITSMGVSPEITLEQDQALGHLGEPPTVTINQAVGQADPTSTSPINFTVIFDTSVSGFATGDVTLSGTAGATTATVTPIAPNDGTTYNVAVSGMTSNGTVIASVPAGAATNTAGNSNTTSTSTDNTVTFITAMSIATCGGYTVFQTNPGQYSAPGWNGTINVGTNANNTINGTSGADLILGLGGNDRLYGKGGDDVICGGDGNDLIEGAVGNDNLDGGGGNDLLRGEKGDYDVLLGGAGNDGLFDLDGVDGIYGGAGIDLITFALRKGWRDRTGTARFVEKLSGGYQDDLVIFAIVDRSTFFIDITGDERDNPPLSQEGRNDTLALAARFDPASVIVKFEHSLVKASDADAIDEVAAMEQQYANEYGFMLDESGEEATEQDATQNSRIFLPLITR